MSRRPREQSAQGPLLSSLRHRTGADRGSRGILKGGPPAARGRCWQGRPDLRRPPVHPVRRKEPQRKCLTAHSSCLVNASHAPEYGCNLQIYLPSPPRGWLQDWGIVNGQRTPQYREIKRMVLDQVLDVRKRSMNRLGESDAADELVGAEILR